MNALDGLHMLEPDSIDLIMTDPPYGMAYQEPNREYTDSTARGVAKADPEAWRRDGGRLNPPWVEWLMGFPIGHTELSDLEMPSCLKSRKRSAKQSKKPSGE